MLVWWLDDRLAIEVGARSKHRLLLHPHHRLALHRVLHLRSLILNMSIHIRLVSAVESYLVAEFVADLDCQLWDELELNVNVAC